MIYLCLVLLIVFILGFGLDGYLVWGGFLFFVLLLCWMWVGGVFVFYDDIWVDEVVMCCLVIWDVMVKYGCSGVLCFVIVDYCIESGGCLVIEEWQDIVYCDVDMFVDVLKDVFVFVLYGVYCVWVVFLVVLLFCYFVLIFNGYCIYYDNFYVWQVEGYFGLIVYGLLQVM